MDGLIFSTDRNVKMNHPALSVYELHLGYRVGRKEYSVKQHISGKLPFGTLTALIGPNGCGKSTLLRSIAGLQSPLSGTIEWIGRPLHCYTANERARILSVVLTQRVGGLGLKVRNVVEMGRMPYTDATGRLKENDHAIVDEAMATTGIVRFANRSMDTLSDGERQRVMVAKALAQQTPLLLLDEPTAFLDYPSKAELLRLLQKLAEEQQKTILFSTHDLELTFQIVDRLWIFSADGLKEGSPLQLAEQGYLGSLFPKNSCQFDAQELKFKI